MKMPLHDSRSVHVKLSFPDAGLTWTVCAEWDDEGGRVIICSLLGNHSSSSVRLGKAFLFDSDAIIGLGAGRDIVCLPLAGEMINRAVWKMSDPDCPLLSKIKVQLYSRAETKAVQVGFLTFRRANTEVGYECDEEAGISSLSAWCDFGGWALAPGQATSTEAFTLAVGDDPYTQLETWADVAAQWCNPRRWEDAPIGWVGWSWVDPFTVECYEEVVLRNCDAIRRRLKGFGINYVWVSLGNLADVNPGDWLNWNEEFFPNGPEYIASKLREMGFKWGLWCAPFWMCGLLKGKIAEFEDAFRSGEQPACTLLKNEDGSLLIVRPEWQYGAAG